MQVTVAAHPIGELSLVNVDINLSDFEPGLDADGVRETLEIIICDEAGVVDIDEVDLYTEAERVYQALRAGNE
jgi:hypothetical protein